MADFRFVIACLAAWCARATQVVDPLTVTDTVTTTSATQHRADRRFIFSQTVEFTGFSGTAEQAEDSLEQGLENVLSLVSSHLLEGPGSLELGGPVQVSEITSQRRATATDVGSPVPKGRGLSNSDTAETKTCRATFDIVVTGSAFADEILAAARESTPFQLLLRDLDPQIVTSSVSSTELQELPETTTTPIGVLLGTSDKAETEASPVMIGLLASVGAVFVLAGAVTVVRKRRQAAKKKDNFERGDTSSSGDTNNIPGVDSIRNDLDFDQNPSRSCLDVDIDLDSNHSITVTPVVEARLNRSNSEWSGSVGSERSKRSHDADSLGSRQTVEWGIDGEMGPTAARDPRAIAREMGPTAARDMIGKVRASIVDPNFGNGVQKSRSIRSTMSDDSPRKPVEVRLTVASDPSNFSI